MFSTLSTYQRFKSKDTVFLLQVRQPQVESYCSMAHNLQAENLLQREWALVLVYDTTITPLLTRVIS